MQIISIITIFFAMIIIILIILYITKKPSCPPCSNQDQIEKKSIRITPELDIQFSEQNLPSKVYEDVFQNENIWISGYSSGMNAGRSVRNNKK